MKPTVEDPSARAELETLVALVQSEIGGIRGVQSEVARRMGVVPSLVSKMLGGSHPITPDSLLRIRKATAALEAPPEPATPAPDPEATALAALAALTPEARARVLRYAGERWPSQERAAIARAASHLRSV